MSYGCCWRRRYRPSLRARRSFAGRVLTLRRYAQRFPDEVAGLLFLDPGHEDYYAHMPRKKLLTRVRNALAILRLFLHFKQFYRAQFKQMFAEWPDSLRQRLIEYHLTTWRKSLQERKNERELFDEIRHGERCPTCR